MKERSFDEMVAYINRRVSEMDIAQDYKIELLGMVTALGYKHEKTAQQWIPCSERLPEEMGTYMTTIDYGEHGLATGQRYYYGRGLKWNDECVIAWLPLPEPYKAESEE